MATYISYLVDFPGDDLCSRLADPPSVSHERVDKDRLSVLGRFAGSDTDFVIEDPGGSWSLLTLKFRYNLLLADATHEALRQDAMQVEAWENELRRIVGNVAIVRFDSIYLDSYECPIVADRDWLRNPLKIVEFIYWVQAEARRNNEEQYITVINVGALAS